ncbi:hypothetical protein F5Y18DRAFT_438986 [Xylariaceae sp. FL1019]|nr:hypothetical protein F5Y18DRAFT_438986 [Xylariaceae sp. FL1019]
MAALISRVITAFNPTIVEKDRDALRFGVLGAANVGPLALFGPAKTHPDVIVQAVAARDREKAEKYARSNGIPEVKDSYQAILDDPNIDAVYIPLPNAYHFEWAVRSIKAGKHVLLEKPSVCNAEEAEILFNLEELKAPNAPVLLEGFLSKFHPSWQVLQSLVDPATIEHTDIFFNYDLGGGCIMSMGTYNMGLLRQLFDAEPVECLSCETQTFPDPELAQCDTDFKATYRFPNGALGEVESTLRGPTIWIPSVCTVKTKEIITPDKSLPQGHTKVVKRTLSLHGVVHAFFWHRIDVQETYTIRDSHGADIKTYTENRTHKCYNYEEAGGQFGGLPGEVWWMSFHYMLTAFVNKVRGRPVQTWMSGQDSINQMRMIDMAYEKSGLGPRPSKGYRP